MPALSFEPPGPGLWTLDTGHFPRPVTRFTEESFPEPVSQGFAHATSRYGLLLDHVRWAFVHGWAYLCPRPVPALYGWQGSRGSWENTVRSSPELARRLATSATVFERKPWRRELAVWEERLKPALVDAHRRLQAVEPAEVDGEALVSHVERCRENLRRSLRHHHRFGVTPVVPLGDLLANAEGWTGTSAGQLLGLLPRGGPMAVGSRRQLAALAEAVRRDPTAAEALARTDRPADAVLASLRSLPTAAGRATAAYLDLVGHWAAGSGTDVADACLSEMPDLLVAAVRAEVGGGGGTAQAEDEAERAAQVRASVPPTSRRLFDELLGEARSVHRLRDERAVYCDVWANGLLRRALLAAGDRLVAEGRVDQPDHLLEAGPSEVRPLLTGTGGPGASELAERRHRREEAGRDSPPEHLGGPGRTPVPTAWLPEGAARTERAFRTYLAAMSGATAEDGGGGGSVVRGVGASAGVHEGTARVVRGPSELARVREGDVLVAEATSPALNVALTLVGAIVTEQGGLLSHAAIVARELGVPAVVACPGATRRIPDGARLRVDGSSGQAVVLLPS